MGGLEAKGLEVLEALLEERDRAWEERKKLLMRMKKAESLAERDRLFKEYSDYGLRIDEINRMLRFSDKGIVAEIWKNGVTIKSEDPYSEVLIPHEVFEKIMEWYSGFKQEVGV